MNSLQPCTRKLRPLTKTLRPEYVEKIVTNHIIDEVGRRRKVAGKVHRWQWVTVCQKNCVARSSVRQPVEDFIARHQSL
ncbi:hypothetical protein RHMOL_Rhmol11G0263400 [Rhododendron molle]|uniref:Uncharacterized protein n=1 Tax=Rhododendron molle TaxID=49168 RepID=A0ACC0LWG0_RHOML|nr:hypothetical protein RHMOL_Rhmol11G0263400 [Rhododendron molle]